MPSWWSRCHLLTRLINPPTMFLFLCKPLLYYPKLCPFRFNAFRVIYLFIILFSRIVCGSMYNIVLVNRTWYWLENNVWSRFSGVELDSTLQHSFLIYPGQGSRSLRGSFGSSQWNQTRQFSSLNFMAGRKKHVEFNIAHARRRAFI